jgi:AraC family transcriptional regulator, transcriptional activator FtrA
MMCTFVRVVVYVIAFLALPLGVGFFVLRSALATYLPPTPVQPVGRDFPTPPELDPQKPTVAVVLGNGVTEVGDTLAPYVAFKTAGAFNVITVADRNRFGRVLPVMIPILSMVVSFR